MSGADHRETPAAAQPVFVTGLSGAGLSSALKALEDLGYEVFDNFPLSLVPALIADQEEQARPLAIGIDTRSRGFDPEILLNTVRRFDGRLLFMSCDEAELQRRFTETRRRHPLAKDRPVSAGIKKEMALLYPLRGHADPIIDTTELTIHDLKRSISGHFNAPAAQQMTVTFLSFGFKHGLPREADMVFDARFLRNPHWDTALKPLTGQDAAVAAYIGEDPDLAAFLQRIQDLLRLVLPRFRQEGKSYLTIAIGCTGGRHRSVFLAETLAGWAAREGFSAGAEHRDIDR